MLKIILTGPESSGKTTLSEAFSQHFNASYVKEYAREYFEKKKTPQYNQSDLTEIAFGQIQSEIQNTNFEMPLLICDTDILTIKIWSEVVYGNCLPELKVLINTQLKTQNPKLKTLYLLCSHEGIDWEYDPLRENPNDRDLLFNIYEKELIELKKDYIILRGTFAERLYEGLEIITRLLE